MWISVFAAFAGVGGGTVKIRGCRRGCSPSGKTVFAAEAEASGLGCRFGLNSSSAAWRALLIPPRSSPAFGIRELPDKSCSRKRWLKSYRDVRHPGEMCKPCTQYATNLVDRLQISDRRMRATASDRRRQRPWASAIVRLSHSLFLLARLMSRCFGEPSTTKTPRCCDDTIEFCSYTYTDDAECLRIRCIQIIELSSPKVSVCPWQMWFQLYPQNRLQNYTAGRLRISSGTLRLRNWPSFRSPEKMPLSTAILPRSITSEGQTARSRSSQGL